MNSGDRASDLVQNSGISELSRKGELMVAKCGSYQCVTTTDAPRNESDYLFALCPEQMGALLWMKRATMVYHGKKHDKKLCY